MIQIAAAAGGDRDAEADENFSMPHHCYEYCNTLGWFFDNFDHPLRLRLLYRGSAFLNRVAWHQQGIGDVHAVRSGAARRRTG